ncbi:LPS assembly protein LptD [Archangium violaceum]|uniref:LPS-assembly protein LptD n=1 Tax=Archangium violaceum TaxID=83451 RepID=UPI0019522878|nr:LPS assembly protein LptD [Archangium violaceum]QRN94137.1 LPS assembly protein LptD [Archangium violaceum]
MSFLLPVAVLLVSAQLPLSTQLQLPTGETAELAADYVLYEPERQVLTARGHTVLRSGELLLRADELSYDQVNQVAVARGSVMLVNGLMAAVADEVTVDVESQEANVKGGLFMQKRGVSPEALFQARTPQELRNLGETPVLMSGTRIKRTGQNSFEVDGLAFAPCLCEAGTPSWRLEASSAEVALGEHATLTWPVVYVHSVPVFALPWLYLPLAERRSGLLIPRPSFSGLNGVSFEQPVFITLGRSYDLTLTPAYYLGRAEKDVTRTLDGESFTRPEPGRNGIRGPRLLTEFRYMPSAGTEGRATLGLLYDFHPVRNPVTGDFFLGEDRSLIRERRGLRGEASLQHRQDLGGGFHDRIDAFVVSDGFYTRDITADIIARENQYLRSTGVLYHRGEDHWAGLEVGLRQDIRWGYGLLGSNTAPAGAVLDKELTPAPRTFQRLPNLTWALPERPLFGRLVGGMKMEFTRLSPLLSRFGDEGEDGRHDPDRLLVVTNPSGTQRDPDPAQGNGLFDASDREARDRVDLLPRLSSSFALGPYARLSPALSLRQDFYLGEVSGRAAQRGYPMLDLVVDSELARTFQFRGSTLRHSLVPSVRLRYVPLVWGGLPPPGASPERPGQVYDEVDAALPVTPPGVARRFLHAVVELHQTLGARQASGARSELLRLTLGQGFDLSRHMPTLGQGVALDDDKTVRDTFGRLTASLGAFSGGGVIRYDPNTREIAQLSADFQVSVPQGSIFARYDDLMGVGSDRLRRSLDALVGPALSSAQRAQFLTAGTQVSLGFGLGIRYEAIVQPQARNESPLSQQWFAVSYGPACNCWRIEGVARLARGQTFPDFGANLTITGVGTFGTGG